MLIPDHSISKCPCELQCEQRREDAVNLVLKKRFCTSNEIKVRLREKGLGEYTIRKNLEFLRLRKCRRIDVLNRNNRRFLQFKDHGRVFFVNTLPKYILLRKVHRFLTNLQKEILRKFTKHHRSIYYFSMYDIKKMLPYGGTSVEYAVHRLSDLGFIEGVRIGRTQFFVEAQNMERLKDESKDVLIKDKTEFTTIKAIHEIIMNIYPLNLLSLKGAIRPRSQHKLTLTGGMTFDIFYQFNKRIGTMEFLAIDVYTRIPVNGYVVNSFLKKIEWATNKLRSRTVYPLKNKTFGMIVFRNATPRSIRLANEKGIRFIRLSDIKIDYDAIRKNMETTLSSESPRIR